MWKVCINYIPHSKDQYLGESQIKNKIKIWGSPNSRIRSRFGEVSIQDQDQGLGQSQLKIKFKIKIATVPT